MTRCGFVVVLVLFASCAELRAESHLMRFADVHGEQVVFTYEGDLWLASTQGGPARRLTRDEGVEQYAKFSPDGRQIAFTANYDGGTDVYVMDLPGGRPRRLTYHPADDNVLDWFPDGQSIIFRSRRNYPYRADQVYQVPAAGGMAQRLPVDRAGLTSLSPDGRSIVYNRISTEFRTWKRYQGGMAPDLWLGSLEQGDFHRITDWKGSDQFPMWDGDSIYFVSDREHGTLNLYRCDTDGKNVKALTSYSDYDVKYPSLGPGAIVYQHAESLHLLDLKTGQTRELAIEIPSDEVPMRETYVDATENMGAFGLSPSGARVLLESRGEILNLPAESGEPINLTRTSGTREKNAAWSPDGRHIAFISDKTGEEELYLVDPKREEPWRQLTEGGKGFRQQLAWSPDSRHILFADKSLRLNMADAESGEIKRIDQGDYDDAWERWGIMDYVWSPDSRWIAYTKVTENINEVIYLYSLEKGERHAVTDDWSTSFSPSFDPKGRYLYYLSNRTYEPVMGAVDHNHIFLEMCRPYVVILKKGQASPFFPKEDEEKLKEVPSSQESEEKHENEDKKADQPAKTEIDVDGLASRTVAADGVDAGNYFRLEATEKGFCYLKKEKREFLKYQTVTDVTPAKLDLYGYELDAKPDDRGPTKLIEGINNYHVSADGKKLVYRSEKRLGVVKVGEKAKVGDGEVDLKSAKLLLDRRAEYMQIFNEAFRVQRDWFYDPGMHQVDWPAIAEMYRKFVPYCGNRSDLTYLIGEMISELNAGHTYVYGGDSQDRPKKVPVGMLGVDFLTNREAPYHRIRHIVPGVNWDDSLYSPLAAPDCPIREGDYLIAIDGDEVPSTEDVYRYLQDKAERVVTLLYNSRPSKDGAKSCRVRTIASENAIRYRAWVERNRARVARASGGRIGYVHLPDMMEPGLIEFARAFHPQHVKEAMIIDERYNGGGFVGDMIIDRLERKLWAITQPREGKPLRNPEDVFHGHLRVIMNEDTGSNGEYFAEAIRRKGLARIIGMRTWGGAVGIEPHQLLVDGGTTTPPQFAPYGLDRTWLIEGYGVEPDHKVENLPPEATRGEDVQLLVAIEELKRLIDEQPMKLPPTPPYPDKKK